MYKNQKVTFLNCQLIERSPYPYTNNKIENATVVYLVDRIILGKYITEKESNNINNYVVKYDNIDCFTNSVPYKFNNETSSFSPNITAYNIKIKDIDISIQFSCKEARDIKSYNVERLTLVEFKHYKINTWIFAFAIVNIF